MAADDTNAKTSRPDKSKTDISVHIEIGENLRAVIEAAIKEALPEYMEETIRAFDLKGIVEKSLGE